MPFVAVGVVYSEYSKHFMRCAISMHSMRALIQGTEGHVCGEQTARSAEAWEWGGKYGSIMAP
jgi:hypothetical protein